MKRSQIEPKSTWKRLQRGSKPLGAGKKTSEWVEVRRQVKKRFEWAGITICEFRFRGCMFNDYLSFAHCKKRRKLQNFDIWHVALACQNCHTILDEKLSHEEMYNAVHEKISQRGLLVPPAVLQQIQSHQNGS